MSNKRPASSRFKEGEARRNKATTQLLSSVGLSVLMLAGQPASALAQQISPATSVQSVSLAAGDLSSRISALGELYNVNLTYSSEDTDAFQVAALQGSLSLQQALELLIRDTGLAVTWLEGGAIIHKPNQASSEESQSSPYAEQDTLLVLGRAGLDKIDDTATKMDVSIRDTSRSVVVLDSRALQEMSATDVDQVLDYMPGFSKADAAAGSLVVRGLTTDYNNVLIDGLRSLQGANDGDGGRTGSLLPSTYNLEAVSFMRGQDGLLYGSGMGGGMINLTTKKPEDEAMTSIGIVGTTHLSDDTGYFKRNKAVMTLDSTGPLSEDLLYRAIIQKTPDGENFQDDIEVDETLADLSLTYIINDNTRITPRIEYVRRNYQGVGSVGAAIDQTSFDNTAGYGTPSQRKYYYGSSSDYNNNKTLNADVTLEHNFNDDWKLTSRARYSRTDAEKLSLELSSTDTGNPNTRYRRWRGYDNNDEYKLLDIGLQGKFATGQVQHHLLFGGSYRDFNTDYGGAYQSSSDTDSLIDVTNPNNQQVGVVPANVASFAITPKAVKDINIYLKDRINFGRLTLSPGLSYVAQEQVRSRSSQLNYTDVYDGKHSQLIWDLGALYEVSDQTNIYANYSYSYDPINVRYIAQYGNEKHGLGSDDYVPVEGNNYEIGIKSDLFDKKLTAAVNLFKLDRINKTRFDCSYSWTNSGTSCLLKQDGDDFTSKGVEIDLSYRPTHQWSGSINYAYTRAAYTSGDDKGVQEDNTPKHSLAIWNRYRLSGDLNDFKLGMGIRYESKRTFASKEVPGYVEADFGVYYDQPTWEASLVLKNAFDKNRVETGSSWYETVTPNEPRSLTLTFKHHFY